jgi:hypothetical protein
MLSNASYALVLLASAPVQLDGEVTCSLVAGDDLLDKIACEVNQRLDSPPVEGICTFPPNEPWVLAESEDVVLKARGDCETLEVTAELTTEDTLSCEMGVYGDWGYSDFGAGPGPDTQNSWRGELSRQPTVIAEIEPKAVSVYTVSLKCER